MADLLVGEHQTAELAAALAAQIEFRQQGEFPYHGDHSYYHHTLDDGERGGLNRGVHIDVWEYSADDEHIHHEAVDVLSHDVVVGRLRLLLDQFLHHAKVHYFCFCQTLIEFVPAGFQCFKFHINTNLTIRHFS